MKLLVFWYCDSFCDCQMLNLVGSYNMPNVTYVMFGVLLCLAATPIPSCQTTNQFTITREAVNQKEE